jgi:hypothetical protein
MTTTEVMKLKTVAPAYLIARAGCDAAMKTLRSTKTNAELMASRNVEHADEVARKSRSGSRLITNGQALRRGSGSGFVVVYTRCRCDGFPDECAHDPRDAPYSDDALAAADKAIAKAEKALEATETNLTARPHALDAFANAREAGARYVYWPIEKFVDPRIRHWQGQPIPDPDLATLGPHELRRGIDTGSIIEVT